MLALNINDINDPQKTHRLGTVSKRILLKGQQVNRFHGAPTSPLSLDVDWGT